MKDIKIVCGPHGELSRGSLYSPVAVAAHYSASESRPRMWMMLGRSAGAQPSQEGFGAPIAHRPGFGVIPDPDEPENPDAANVAVVTGDSTSPARRRTVLTCPRKRCRESLTLSSEDDLYALLDGLSEGGVTEVSIAGLRFAHNARREAEGRTMS